MDTWQREDKPFHEFHNFPNILAKVMSQAITTIIGGPGSGKTAMARHIALRLQTEKQFDIVPVSSPSGIIQYGHADCMQLFILDDVIGVFGVERGKHINLEDHKERILNLLRVSKNSKILFTCRKAVFNEASDLESFVLKKEFIVDLEENNNLLNEQDRAQILKNHCIQNAISLGPDELPSTVTSTVGIMMYPLLCKLYCSESKYRSPGKEFFETPHSYILKEIKSLRVQKPMQYASLVLCMFCQNEITLSSLTRKDPKFMEIREKVFENCRVTGCNTEIHDSLKNMVDTFTARTNEGYSLIHDSVYEVLAFHYGNKHQEDMLLLMNSSFVAKKFNIDDISDDPGDLHIKIQKEHYLAFAERLVRDLKCLELHDVFMNTTLKNYDICNAFIDELKKLPYPEIQKLFFKKQEDTLKIFDRSEKEGSKLKRRHTLDPEWMRQKLLMGIYNWRGKPNIRVISWVIYFGHRQLLQFLFNLVTEHNESIWRVMDISDQTEQTRLLVLGAYNGDLEIMKLLLKHCDTECVSKTPRTIYKPRLNPRQFYSPLTAACINGHKLVVEELIRSGANIHLKDLWGITALHGAAESGHQSIVEYLMLAGADCNVRNESDETPLYAAALEGHLEVVDYLLKHGGDASISDSVKRFPLHAASKAGHSAVVDLLIKFGVDCDPSDKDNKTPLHEASMGGFNDIVDLLIKCGADVNKKDKEDRTPLYAASEAGHDAVVDLLIKGGADCNENSKDGRTSLYVASKTGYGAVINLLIKGGADCNKSYKYGKTPLYVASEAGHKDVINLLVRNSADLNKCNDHGRSPLHAASWTGHRDVVHLLIEHGSDVNKRNKFGRTPLHAASMAGHENVVELLIRNGADCNQSDTDGRTPLQMASEAGHSAVVDLLIKCGAEAKR